jgi:hypothetical protein
MAPLRKVKMNSNTDALIESWKKAKKTIPPKVSGKARKQALLNMLKKGK